MKTYKNNWKSNISFNYEINENIFHGFRNHRNILVGYNYKGKCKGLWLQNWK